MDLMGIYKSTKTRWWQVNCFWEFSPQKLGFQDPILTNAHIFQLGGLFNHQLVIVEYIETINVCFALSLSTLPVTNVVLFTTLKRLDNFVGFHP